MALTARFKEQAAAQLGECGWRSEVRQLGACLKPTHHLVTVKGVREGLPTPKLSVRIRDADQQQLPIGNQPQWHAQSRGSGQSFNVNNKKEIPQASKEMNQEDLPDEE